MRADRLSAEQIFSAAREKRDPRERAAYLDGACGQDLGLRAKVEALLEADSDAESFFEKARERLHLDVTEDVDSPGGAAAVAPFSGERTGDVIGRYKLLQPIGEGGFGSVWMAEQREPVRRQVALKIIKLGMDTKEVIARFEIERQALALMDHPNICKVLDAGSTESGRPYFVMELVRGVPITEYCDTEKLSSRKRLELFIQVCNAVQHAHQKGIIHRDLKPSNVMVTLHDGKPVPKVIDFGIAKATHRELTEKTVFTQYRQFVGTPEYMSPEQAEMSGLDIDTRSDVYSLGVLLYELLTGLTPFDSKSLRSAALEEVRRIIREVDPPKPSTRLSTLEAASGTGDGSRGTASGSIARSRSTEPQLLVKALRGDLDWIVMKALEKERTRRYETASGLALDVERYLNSEPVFASPPSRTYKLRKFLARNRASVVAAALVLLVLVVGIIGTTYGLWRALGAERIARGEKDEAKRQAAIAAAVNRFLNDDLLAAVAPSAAEGRGRDVKMIDVLRVAARRIDQAAATGGRLADKPLIEAAIRATIGHTLSELGDYSSAEPHLQRALVLQRENLGHGHRDTLVSTLRLAYWHHEQRRWQDAERLFREVLERTRTATDEMYGLTSQSLTGLAELYTAVRRFTEARQLLEEARTVLSRAPVDTPELRADVLVALGTLYAHQDLHAEAEVEIRKALEIRRSVHGEGDLRTLTTRLQLARQYRKLALHAQPEVQQHALDKAQRYFEESLDSMTRALGPAHPISIRCSEELAKLLAGTGRFSSAEKLLRQSVETLEKDVGEDDRSVLRLTSILATIHSTKGEYARATELLGRTLETQRSVLGKAHPDALQSMEYLARACFRAGMRAEAEQLVEVALDISTADWREYPDSICHMHHLADAYRRQGLHAESERLYLRAIETMKEILGPENRHRLGAITNLGILYNRIEKFDLAIDWLEENVRVKQREFGIQDRWTRNAMEELARAYTGIGRHEDALQLQRELLEFRMAVVDAPGASAQDLNELAWNLLTGPEALRDPERAHSLARRACRMEEEAGGANLLMYLDTLALALFETGDLQGAVDTQKEALSLRSESVTERVAEEMQERLERFEKALAASGGPMVQGSDG